MTQRLVADDYICLLSGMGCPFSFSQYLSWGHLPLWTYRLSLSAAAGVVGGGFTQEEG